jgi:signal transduction histidine kinase
MSEGLAFLTLPAPDLDEARAALKRIVNDGHRASDVIASVRAMFGRDPQKKALVDVNDLAREVLALVHGELQSQHISLQTELRAEVPQVVADRVQLQQVLLNLIMNAAEAMAPLNDGARVLRVTSERHNPAGVLISVQDSGPGIDPEIADKIFDAFFTTKSTGMGMGLSICRSIVESHGGRLSVSAAQPHGSVFQVALPTEEASIT